jgi:hypothetical protein
LPEPHCAVNISILCAFVATTQQENNLCSGLCVVEPVSRARIDTQFPHSIAAEAVVAKVTLFYPVHALGDRI